MKLSGAAFFGNYLKLKSELEKIPLKQNVVIDCSNISSIDHTVIDNLHHFCRDYWAKGGQARMEGLDKHKAISEHPLSARKLAR